MFLDVTKAYDKAWLDGILYNLYNRGVTGPTWNMIRKFNLNLKAEIKTNHGLTRPIQIRDSIRQGGVLSVLLYAAIMDEISTETMKENLGIQIKNQNTKVGCMLWMDDVVLISDNREEMQELLNKTNEVANMYHLEFGKEKSKVMTFNTTDTQTLQLGDMELEKTDKYKYLGETISSKANLCEQLGEAKKKS